MLRLSRVLALVALCQFTGAQWIGLQSVAWTRMLLQEAPGTRFTQLVEKTFDGAHPCRLCKRIDHAQGTQKKSTVPVEIGKIPLVRGGGATLIVFTQTSSGANFAETLVPVRFDQPDFPPPRFC